MPDQEKQFIAIIEKYGNSYNAANDVANPAYQSRRANEICELFNGNLSVTDWIGHVKDHWRVSDGRVGFAVWLPAFEISNSNNVTLLSGEETLISSTDSLNRAILRLNLRQGLRFSGQFMPSTKDCLQEVSMTRMREPQWFFKFNSVRPQVAPGAR